MHYSWYAITINPPEACLYDYDDVFNKVRESIKRLHGSYLLYTELSKIGRLHFHGICKFPTKLHLILDQMQLKEFQICIKELLDLQDWLLYCQKNQDMFSEDGERHILSFPKMIVKL